VSEINEIIEKVSNNSGKTIEEIKSKMQARKEKTHGLLSDYGAVYAVAKELGVGLNEGALKLTKIKDFKPATPVNFYARVKMVYSEREFKRKDGSNGKFASILLLDDTAEVRLVLWDENTELTKKTMVGDSVLVKNGFVKDNKSVLEVHAGSLTNLSLNPKNIDAQLPQVEEKVKKIIQLTANDPSVNLICRVSSYYPKTEFNRKDGSIGARASFIGEDDSGKIRIVLWDNAAQLSISEGLTVKIENGYTKEGLNGGVELQVGNRGRIFTTEEKLNLPPIESKREKIVITDLKPDNSGFNLEARVLRVYPKRDYEGGSLASLLVSDETATARVVLWDERSKDIEKLDRGDAILIENAYSRSNMSDEVEVHVGKYGTIKKIDDSKLIPVSEMEGVLLSEKKIADLEPSPERFKISAKVVELDESRPLLFTTCPSCGKRVQNLGGTWFCEACGDVDPDVNMIVSVILEDETGNIRAVAFRDAAEKILGFNIEAAMNVIGQTADDTAPLKSAKENLMGSQLTLTGRVKYNDYSDQIEFLVDEILD